MPLSDHRHRPWVAEQLKGDADGLGRIRSVVDVGAGFGGWREFLQPHMPYAKWTAVEVWEPYVDRFLLRYRYSDVIVGDARTVILPEADLYIVGDVLEHMPDADARPLWDRIIGLCWRAVLCLPIVHYPQGEAEGNPYEAHVATWDLPKVGTLKGIDVSAGHINEVTGAFIAIGARGLD